MNARLIMGTVNKFAPTMLAQGSAPVEKDIGWRKMELLAKVSLIIFLEAIKCHIFSVLSKIIEV